jgi:glycosyltransferase involved in cell wall biosynthesis
MEKKKAIKKVAFLGDYVPRKCGIATFTQDLRTAIAAEFPDAQCLVIPVNDIEGGYDYPEEVRFEISEPDLSSYLRAADFLNISNIDILCVQHEFGIYGGQTGSHVLALLREARMPIVTTLHTILQDPSPEQRRVMSELIRLSTRLVTMAEKGRRILLETYSAPESKIDLIPHGIPDIPFADPNYFKDEFGVIGRQVLLTFGLLSPNKGIEYVLRALPDIVTRFPDVVFIVVGQTHPALLRREGEQYRLGLMQLAQSLGIQRYVVFYNRYVELNELLRFIGAADIYVTPYVNEAQITSGTLAYAYGTGNAVISTPYWHAAELLAEGRGRLVPFEDSKAIAQAAIELLGDEAALLAMRKRAYQEGRDMIWSRVAEKYMGSFLQAKADYSLVGKKASPIRTLDEQPGALPDLRLDHILRLCDSTGVFQHASYVVPEFSLGYCTDDNARAFLLAQILMRSGRDAQEIRRLSSTCLAFLNYALDRKAGRFRNFLGFDRRWSGEPGSEDCHGHALWALGYCIGNASPGGTRMLAAELFEESLAAAAKFTSPRAWATSLLGIDEYLCCLGGDRRVSQLREALSGKLLDRFVASSMPDWPWFEDSLAYDNARLPQALIRSGQAMKDPAMLKTALGALEWLIEVQSSVSGAFSPIGTNGFFARGGERTQFDQQPIEAESTVSACIAAYDATEDLFWIREARRAFEWFLGRNDVGLLVYDESTGGCHDGLHIDRLNQNEGGESTLAFLLALTEMQAVQSTTRSPDEEEEKR